jgi:sugar phosphate isomerase/epimerase
MRDLSKDHRFLSINWATTREQFPRLEQLAVALARADVRGISPWREPVQEIGAKAAGKLIRDHGLTVTGYCRGGLFSNQGRAGLKAQIEDNRRCLDEAAEIGAACVVMVAGSLAPGSKDIRDARAMAREGLAELLPYARQAGVALGIEPLHPKYAADRCTCTSLGEANDICEALDPRGQGGIGVVVDVYHVWWDHRIAEEIARAGRGRRILAFHICDWLVPMRDMLLDRGMMGDGAIDIPHLRGLVEAAGYDGFCEVEIFSADTWWKKPGDEVIKTCIERYRTVV